MSKSRRLTDAECEILRKNPNVKLAVPGRFVLTFDFRIKLYEYWNSHNRTNQDIRDYMTENGFDISLFAGTCIFSHLNEHMVRDGYPSNGKNKVPGQAQNFRSNEENNQYMVSTGRFIRRNKGITFSESFAEELYQAYPNQTIEEGLKKAGIDPDMVGYQRIYALKRRFEDTVFPGTEKRTYSSEEIERYSSHPYVQLITEKQLILKPAFYSDAHCLRDMMHINDILKLFEIEPKFLTISRRNNIRYKLRVWKEENREYVYDLSDQNLRILNNVMEAVDKAAEASLSELHDLVPSLTKTEKKRLCQIIDPVGKDPGGKYTKRYILKRIGISKSTFYSCQKNSHYGIREEAKDLQDEEDRKVIQQVMEYKGYPKGTRQVYMMMKDITGKQFGINKIRRLKRKYGIICPVRQPSVNRKAARELMERNRKANILKRTFRMHRPNEVYLSDVTYLKYGNNQTAYGSAVIDAVTGKLAGFVLSDHNDLALADSTLEWLKICPYNHKALFHTDQGSLYMSDQFQRKLKKMGIRQSMSKRGNCWDNAPQESFFGHFKDEVDYSGCRDIGELDQMVYEYMQYYNRERKQWSRNRMTPLEYEKYLNEMDAKQFREYIRKETEKYNAMKANAEKQARERSKTLGI